MQQAMPIACEFPVFATLIAAVVAPPSLVSLWFRSGCACFVLASRKRLSAFGAQEDGAVLDEGRARNGSSTDRLERLDRLPHHLEYVLSLRSDLLFRDWPDDVSPYLERFAERLLQQT